MSDEYQPGFDQNQQGDPIQVYDPPPQQQSPPPQQYSPPQQQYAPPPYAPPPYTQPYQQNESSQWPPMKVGNWVVTWLLMLIPIANIVLVFMWAFGSDVNPSKKSFFQAYLILMVVGIVLGIVVGILFGAVLASLFTGPFYGLGYYF